MGQRPTSDEIGRKIEGCFSRLDASSYVIKSEYDPSYNCAAFAVNDTERWWEPVKPDGYWPADVPRDWSVDAYVAAFETVGFHRCDSSDVEEGFEKLAIYGDAGEFMHAARQLSSGWWASKLGKSEDIEHSSLEDLAGDGRCEYGTVAVFMKRKRG